MISNSSYSFETVIIGGGILGISILQELTERGLSNIALIDQGQQTTSATSQSGGLIRVFHEHPKHVQLALNNFRRLSNFQPLIPHGNLYFFHPRRFSTYKENLKIMQKTNYPFEVLSFNKGEKRFPQFFWGKKEWAIFEPLALQLSPLVLTDKLQQISLNRGATILSPFDVLRLSFVQDQFRLHGKETTVICKNLILAGGARLLPRLKDLGINLALQTKTLKVFRAQKINQKISLPNYFNRETLQFAAFNHSHHILLSETNCNRVKEKFWNNSFTEQAAEDCYSEQRLGIIGQLPCYSRLFIATGFGGTSFKFALEIAHQLATLATNQISNRSCVYA